MAELGAKHAVGTQRFRQGRFLTDFGELIYTDKPQPRIKHE
jgi:hypothetical protein